MTYVVSNLHGEYEKFLELLRVIRFKDEDVMYLLGDIVDYGEGSMELVADLSVRLNVYPVAGEHDFLAVRMLEGFERMQASGSAPDPEFVSEMTAWVKDGGEPTLRAFRDLDDDEREGVLDYLGDMALFEEAEVNGVSYVMVHAGIADYEEGDDPADYLPEDFFAEPLSRDRVLMPGKTVIVGHVPTPSGKIERGEGSIFLDCGVCKGGSLGCLCLETGEETYV